MILRLEPPRAQRPVSRRSGLRLLPLDGFVWGSHSTPPQPRTRTDHVLLWVTAGALRLDLPGRRTLMGPGTVHYLPAGTGFATLPLGGARGMVLLLSADLARGAAPALPEAPVSGSIGAAAPSLLAALTDLAREAAQGNDAQSRAAVACHLGLLALRLARLDPPPARPLSATPAAPDLPLVDRFLALAAANLGSGRTVGELAESLGVTTPVLDRACRGARGRRAIELIHDLRHETAVRLLRTTALPLAEIARELGFSSHAHFTRAFVSRTGRLPEAFRHG